MNDTPDYRHYSITDFVWDENFRDWVLSPQQYTDAFWQNWLSENPEKRSTVQAARAIVSSVQITEPVLSGREVDNEVSRLVKALEFDSGKKKGILTSMYSRRRVLGLTACLMIFTFLGIGWYLIKPDEGFLAGKGFKNKGGDKMIRKVNASGQNLAISLPDGSKVILEKFSTISYPPDFNQQPKRKIYLTGTALFEVKKNPASPFVVFTHGLITEVLGTKFRINSSDAGKVVSVEVLSGVVAVYSFIDKNVNEDKGGKKLNSLILTANLKASYSSEDKTLMSSVVENPQVVSESRVNFTFEDTSIDSVFSSIQRAYGITIIYDEKALGRRTFTAALNDESMYEKMDVICKTINASYEIIDGKIVVQMNTH